MKSTQNRAKVWIVLMLLLTVLVGCKGDSPTAPPPGSNPNPPGGGGPTTPAGIVVTLETSNTTPLTSTTSVIRATVTDNGTAVPNGTAVEFTTTFGTFTENGAATIIRTTTSGVATATLSSAAAGSATVTVRVNNAIRTAVVSFRAPVPPVSTTVTVTSVNPATGKVAGGEVITITGTNFDAPVRVLFGTVEAQVISVTSTEIRVLTPPTVLGPSTPTRDVPITVISRAGTTDEQRVVAGTLFRFALDILTPNVITVSPASGPNEGNTRITIIGENFQPQSGRFSEPAALLDRL